MDIESMLIDPVYDVLYVQDNSMKRVTVDHTALAEVIKEIQKTGIITKITME